MNEANQLLKRYQNNLPLFIKEVLGDDLWSIQEEILNAITNYKYVNVRSANSTGKSFVAARAALAYLLTRPYSTVAITAPTERQVEKVLFGEIHSAIKNAKYPLIDFKPHKMNIEVAPKWSLFGFTASHPDNVSGIHSKDLLVIVDEAVGVRSDIFEALDGVLASRDAKLLAIGNPTSRACAFYEFFRKPRENSKQIRISVFDTPNYSNFGITENDIKTGKWRDKYDSEKVPYPALNPPPMAADFYAKYGDQHPAWYARILGEFPSQSSNSVFDLKWLEDAQERQLNYTTPVQLGCDVARFGDDETVISVRYGKKFEIYKRANKQDLMTTVGMLIQAYRETNAGLMVVDDTGIGGGVVDRLKEQGFPVYGFVASQKADERKYYYNRRAEAYFWLREELQNGRVDLPPNEELFNQLSGILYYFLSTGQVMIERKDEMKKRGAPSPDLADSLVLANMEPIRRKKAGTFGGRLQV